MNDKTNEQLSALMDGELPSGEIKSVLLAFKTQKEIRRRWLAYHLARDSMHNHLPEIPLQRLAMKIPYTLDDEPLAVKRSKDISKQVYLKWQYLASLALAASLSAVTVLGIQALMSKPIPLKPQAISGSPQVISNFKTISALENNHPVTVLDRGVKERLNTYLVNHTEYINMPGMLRYGRIVFYENPR